MADRPLFIQKDVFEQWLINRAANDPQGRPTRPDIYKSDAMLLVPLLIHMLSKQFDFRDILDRVQAYRPQLCFLNPDPDPNWNSALRYVLEWADDTIGDYQQRMCTQHGGQP
jgi:hypothetical protein